MLVLTDVHLGIQGEDHPHPQPNQNLELVRIEVGGKDGTGVGDAPGVCLHDGFGPLEEDDLLSGGDGVTVFPEAIDGVQGAHGLKVGVFPQPLFLETRVQSAPADVDDFSGRGADGKDQAVGEGIVPHLELLQALVGDALVQPDLQLPPIPGEALHAVLGKGHGFCLLWLLWMVPKPLGNGGSQKAFARPR